MSERQTTALKELVCMYVCMYVLPACYCWSNAVNVANFFGRFRPCLVTTVTKSVFTLQTRQRQRIRIRNKKTVLLFDAFGRWKLHFVTSSKFADLVKPRHGTSWFFAPVFCGSNSNFITVIWVACEANKSASRLHSDIQFNCDVRYRNITVPRKLPPFGTWHRVEWYKFIDFWEELALHIQRVTHPNTKIEGASSAKMSVNFYQVVYSHIPEENHLHS